MFVLCHYCGCFIMVATRDDRRRWGCGRYLGQLVRRKLRSFYCDFAIEEEFYRFERHFESHLKTSPVEGDGCIRTTKII